MTYVSMEIGGENGTKAGCIVMKLDTSAMQYLVEAYQREGRLQTIVAAAYGLAIFTIVLTRFRVRNKKGVFRPLACALLICTAVLGTLGADIAVEAVKDRQEIALNVNRSAQRMAQTLQQEIDSVVDKGVKYDDIYSLESYFTESARSVSSVDSFRLDLNDKVVAVPSESYISKSASQITGTYIGAWFRVAMFALPLLLVGAVWQIRRTRTAKKEKQALVTL